MFHEYPYTEYFHDIDKMCSMCHKLGYRLEIQGDYLRLINHKNEVISAVKIHYADTALTDIDGKPIQAYIFEASTDGTHIVFTHGDNTFTSLTIPYSERAKEDVQGKDLLDYLYTVSVNGDFLNFTNGKGELYQIGVPYATKALEDVNEKEITTYAASLEVSNDGQSILLKDSLGRVLNSIIAPYALKAFSDSSGNKFESCYGSRLVEGSTEVKLLSPDGRVLSSITVPFSTNAENDMYGNKIDETYGHSLYNFNGNMQLKDLHGNVLSSAEIQDFNAISNIEVVGDQLVFYDRSGRTLAFTIPYAVKAMKDDLGNNIKNTYVASVQNDTQTGALNFYDATGVLIATLTPTVQSATEDNYGNAIADYIKQIIIDNQSNYVLAVHGDGTTDSLTINYSNIAWKDTNGNIIKNSYIKRLEFIEDPNDHHMKLVGYNGDNPEAEICRVDMLVDLSDLSYGKSLSIDSNYNLSLLDPNGATLSTVNIRQDTLPERHIMHLPSYWYDGVHEIDRYDKLVVSDIYDTYPFPYKTVQPMSTYNIVSGNTYWLEISGFDTNVSLQRFLQIPGKTYIDTVNRKSIILGDNQTNFLIGPETNVINRYPIYDDISPDSVIGNGTNEFFKVETTDIIPIKQVQSGEDEDPTYLVDKLQFVLILRCKALVTQTLSTLNDISFIELYAKYLNQYGQFDYFSYNDLNP